MLKSPTLKIHRKRFTWHGLRRFPALLRRIARPSIYAPGAVQVLTRIAKLMSWQPKHVTHMSFNLPSQNTTLANTFSRFCPWPGSRSRRIIIFNPGEPVNPFECQQPKRNKEIRSPNPIEIRFSQIAGHNILYTKCIAWSFTAKQTLSQSWRALQYHRVLPAASVKHPFQSLSQGSIVHRKCLFYDNYQFWISIREISIMILQVRSWKTISFSQEYGHAILQMQRKLTVCIFNFLVPHVLPKEKR